MSEVNYKYDVAFSLMHDDLKIAKDIISNFNKEVLTFLYDEKQEELVGKDGVNIFHDVFEIESRIVVVLHRKS